MNNADFIRQYASEIAEALRSQEESPQTASLEESIPKLYRSLCFDEPIFNDISNLPVVASAMSRQLLSLSSPYALSERLVNGIFFLCKKRKSKDSDTSSSSAESTAIARLAFCISVQLPLQICQNFDNPLKVKKYLGSYKGNLYRESDNNTNDEWKESISRSSDAVIQQQVDKISEAISNGATNIESDDTNIQPDTDSLEEIWAAESDPSDYDYGEGSPDIPHQQLHLEEDDWLDPKTLSKPDLSLTTEHMQLAIGSLLKQANYNMLEPLFVSSKKEIEMYTSELMQLIFILLQPETPLSTGGNKSMDSSFQDALLTPLWILRDAATHKENSQQQQFTSSYLETLQTLLAVDQAHLQDVGGRISDPGMELCTASIVGLSALSSWCTMTEFSVDLTITSILDAMNDISHVVERATEKYRNNLLYSLVPIMELLSGISSDRTKVYGATLSKNIAQTLLNTGFLRQLLVLGLSERVQIASHFHHALWGLSVSYPKLVGKYVLRYHGIPQLVRNYTITGDSSSRECVHTILWNGFGWFGIEETQGPRVVWKSSSRLPVKELPLSRDECKEVCEKAWARLCHIMVSSISEYSETKGPEKMLEALHDLEMLLSRMSVPSIAKAFVQLLDSSNLQAITQALSLMPEEEMEVVKTSEIMKTEEDPDDKLKDPKANNIQVISTTRKLVKQYALFFQGNIGGSSKTD